AEGCRRSRRSAPAPADRVVDRRRLHESDAAAARAARGAPVPRGRGIGGGRRVPALSQRDRIQPFMATMPLIEAVTDALRHEMRHDDRVVVFGEDVGKKGGVFLATQGLQEEFGVERCFDTPLSECGIVGTAVGMAVYGIRPVAEIQFLDFIYPAFDQIVSEAAKMRYRSGGE